MHAEPALAPFVVVILAAGESRRLGEPKALARLGHNPNDCGLTRLVEAGRAAEPDALVVVTGKHNAEIRACVEQLALPVRVLHNPAWSTGRTSGLQLAQRSFPKHDLLVAPVDVPLVPGEVFGALRAEWTRAEAPRRGWLAPACEGRYGHPVMLGWELAAELADLDPSTSLKLLRQRATPLWSLPVDSVRVLDDLDDRDDLARLRLLATES